MNTNKKKERILEDVQIKLSALWVALMLTYFLDTVMRIFAGDFKVGGIGGMQITPIMWLGIAILMVIPVAMVFLSLTYSMSRQANIIFAMIFCGLNLIGLLGHTSVYDKFLIIVGLVFSVLILRYAWRWPNSKQMSLQGLPKQV